MKNTCKLIVDKGVAHLAMPDGTIIPEQRDLAIREPFMQEPQGRFSCLVEVEVTVLMQYMDTIDPGKRLPQEVSDLTIDVVA